MTATNLHWFPKWATCSDRNKMYHVRYPALAVAPCDVLADCIPCVWPQQNQPVVRRKVQKNFGLLVFACDQRCCCAACEVRYFASLGITVGYTSQHSPGRSLSFGQRMPSPKGRVHQRLVLAPLGAEAGFI